MNLGIVILNWNGETLIKKFLPSVIQHTPIKHSIYLIDNGSTDASIKLVKSNFNRVKIVELDKNYGFAKGYNKAIRDIKSKYILLLNNDVLVTKNWIKPTCQEKNVKKILILLVSSTQRSLSHPTHTRTRTFSPLVRSG